jgi:hypothetical protein
MARCLHPLAVNGRGRSRRSAGHSIGRQCRNSRKAVLCSERSLRRIPALSIRAGGILASPD